MAGEGQSKRMQSTSNGAMVSKVADTALQPLELTLLTEEQRWRQRLGHRQQTYRDKGSIAYRAMVAQRLASRTVAAQSGVRGPLMHCLFMMPMEDFIGRVV